MLVTSTYNPDSRTDKCWFESSNILYSEFIEDSVKNEGDLYVTFKNGATYKYKNVLIAPDYLLYKHGDLDGSNGKVFNKIIKTKYEFEKVDSKNVDELLKEQAEVLNQTNNTSIDISKTYFISGHRNISETEFEQYKNAIQNVLQTEPDAMFVVGDYYGVDIMAQNYLVNELKLDPNRITVYHMFTQPRNINPKITNTVGGFESDEERDAAMTHNSTFDIAFVRKHTELSGTAQNLLRRFLLSD